MPLPLAQSTGGGAVAFRNNFELGQSGLDCEAADNPDDNYPCSIADGDPDQFALAVELLDNAWAARHAGTMADALAYLEAQPSVIEVFGDDRAIRFRIEGVMPIWLTDFTGDGLGAAPGFGPTMNSVIGEDTDDSGAIDNRDAKRGLVLAPYRGLLQPFDSSDSLAQELESLRGYTGNVVFRENPDADDQNILLDDYRDWNRYDFIYAATPGARLFDTSSGGSWIVMLSGVRATVQQASSIDATGIVFMGVYDGVETRRFGQYGLVADFFRVAYPSGLDDALVVLPLAEVDTRLAEGLGGEDFALIGWTKRVGAEDGFAAQSGFFKSLRQGLTAAGALDDVAPDLRSVTNADGDTTTLVQIAPGGDGQRIIELPTLVDSGGAALEDGINLVPFVIGRVGDGNPDRLSLQLAMDGVTTTDRDQFVVRYRYASEDLPGVYNLASATQDGAYRYRVNHEVDLDADVAPGVGIPLEAIVDLPQGGTSRFRIDVVVPQDASDQGFNECERYIPKPGKNSNSGLWADRNSFGSLSFNAPGDPGGGYMTVTALSGDPKIVVRLVVRATGDTGAIFSASGLGTDDQQSVTAAFEVPTSASYIAEAIQNNTAREEDYAISWSLNTDYVPTIDCYEPNQSSIGAKRLPLNINGVEAYMLGGYKSNGLNARDYDDWYKLIITQPSRITVDLTQSPEDIRMRLRLWGLNDRQLAIAGGPSPGSLDTLIYEAQPGTYFLSVEAAGLGAGAINQATQEIPDHFSTPYRMNVRTEPLP